MPRTGITREQVFSVADRLMEEGISPTVATVRSDLGKGSFTTINQHLGEWKALKWKAADPTGSVPPKVEAQAHELLTGLWTFASHEANQAIAQIREAALRDVAELQTALQEAQQQVRVLEQERRDLHAQLVKAHGSTETLTREIVRLTEALSAIVRRLDRIEGLGKPSL